MTLEFTLWLLIIAAVIWLAWVGLLPGEGE